jgi:hypothetical protein
VLHRLHRRLGHLPLELSALLHPPHRQSETVDADEIVMWVPTAAVNRRLSHGAVRAYHRLHGFDFKYFPDGSRAVGVQLGGIWDLWTEDALPPTPDYLLMKERFVNGRPWKKIDIYKDWESRLEGKEAEGRIKTEIWDTVFEDMRANGYRLQPDVRAEARSPVQINEGSALNEIQVVMTRSGRLVRVFGGGGHRFIMANFLKFLKFPLSSTSGIPGAGLPQVRKPGATPAMPGAAKDW